MAGAGDDLFVAGISPAGAGLPLGICSQVRQAIEKAGATTRRIPL